MFDVYLFQNPAKQEKNKTFCCFCCASGPLTLVAYVPRTGFAKTEAIPITVEIDNASNVKVESVKAALCRVISILSTIYRFRVFTCNVPKRDITL